VAERVVALTLTAPPTQTPHWTASERHQCQRGRGVWKGARAAEPHRCLQFKLSNDPNIVAKLRDVVGLYVDPPAHAIVLSVDEKSQIQALDRTQPGLPLKKGRLGTMTHDYKWHGATTLFAALNVLDGTVIGRNMQPSSSGTHSISEHHRGGGAGREDHPRYSRQLCCPQASERSCRARSPPAFRLPLHTNLVLLAQRRRGFFCQSVD
jgi:hypothetical protein